MEVSQHQSAPLKRAFTGDPTISGHTHAVSEFFDRV